MVSVDIIYFLSNSFIYGLPVLLDLMRFIVLIVFALFFIVTLVFGSLFTAFVLKQHYKLDRIPFLRLLATEVAMLVSYGLFVLLSFVLVG